jgi:hypothetical protein
MRKTMDKLISWTGLVVAAVLLVAGGLLTWASVFIKNNVTEQLTAQHITMPVAAAFPEGHEKYLEPYAGQPMENGQQAKAYADHYILVHMNESSGGKTYSEISGQYMKLAKDPGADPAAVQELGDLRQSLFMGSTLRGLLLYGYAFDTMGRIAGYAAIAAFAGAGVMLVHGLLGLRHASREPEVQYIETPVQATGVTA